MSNKLIYLISFVLVPGLATGVANAAPLSQSPGPDGIVSVEAEHFDDNVEQSGSRWEEVGPTGGFTGTAGMQAPSGGYNTNYVGRSPRLDYEVNFVKTGTYYVWVLGWGADGNSDSCHAGLDAQAIASCDQMSGWSNNYRWSNDTRDPEPATFEVTEIGLHTFNIWMREDGFIIDKIVLTTNPDFTLTGTEPGPAESPRGPRAIAVEPSPAYGATDVPRDVVLSWIPGEYAPAINGHKVYFSENFSDVNDGIGGITQSATSYARPQRLDFSTTYYWRIDEVNAPPDYTVHEGSVWSFTTEPVAYAIENITATASSTSQEGMGPENTINGSGLDADDLHSTVETYMWLSGSEPPGAWIEYELDNVYKLHEMWVWNSNQMMESFLGLGLKDVTIEYSTNGTDYTTLGTTHEFARAPGTPDYAHNTTVDLSSVTAKYVRLTANSNWGGFLNQYGLSEVRFFYIPTLAREPQPDSEATDVDVDVVLGFRAGREADKHDVYLSSDEQAVIDGNAPVTTVTETSFGPLSLELGTTYYWKINEVNEAETPTTRQGEIWNFTTHEYFVVDDFEDYNDYPPNEIWYTWIDGYGVPTNGATVGYPAPDWNQDEHYVETANVHGGKQAMPFFYDNTGAAAYSEGERTFAVPQDWTKAGVQTLVLYFLGDPNNAVEQMYVKLNGSKVVYDGDAADITQAWWHPWNIDLASFGVNLQNVTKLSIGFGDETSTTPGGSGKVLFDDIQLYRSVPGPPAGIWIEAEAADSITSPMEIYDDPRASRGQCIGTTDDVGNSSDNPPPDGIATYTFTVDGGTYKVSCRIIIPSGDSFWVRIPGATTQTTNHSSGWVRWSDPDDSYNWYWADVFSAEDDDDDAVFFTMPAGTYTLEIAYREDGALLDAILISKID